MTSTTRNLAKGFAPVLLLAGALSLPAAASAQPSPYGYRDPYAGRSGQRGIDGFVTYSGGRCPTIRDHRSGQTYPLAGGTRDLRPGDHVVLSGRLTDGGVCGVRGPALQVLGVRTIWAGANHASAYYDARRDGDFDRFLVRSRNRGGWYADRYSYRRQGGAPRGDRYGQYDDPRNRPYDGQAPYDQRGPSYQGQPNQAPPYQGQPDQAQPGNGYAPNGQYDNRDQPNAPDTAPYDTPDDNGQNGQYDDQYIPNDQAPNGQAPNNGQYDDRSNGGDRQSVTLEGTLDYNRSCPAIRTSNGSYDLAGDLGNFHNGDRVRVTGFVGGASSCGGTAFEVQGIRRR
jgi:hypothetical protein